MNKKPVTCCTHCGRDTTAKCGICQRCLGDEPKRSANDTPSSEHEPIEDDYGDESGPDSVAHDWPLEDNAR